jgi:hypothetical protein
MQPTNTPKPLSGYSGRGSYNPLNYQNHREYYLKYARNYRKKHRKRAKALVGDKCVICGLTKNIVLHEIHGRPHPYKDTASHYRYIQTHISDFLPMCRKCHRNLHNIIRQFPKVEQKEKLIELISNLYEGKTCRIRT